MIQKQYLRPVWAEINLDNLAYNVNQIRLYIGSNVRLMGVVKCNAYGMGMGIIRTLLDHGVDMLGVAILDEALTIRKQDKVIPILVFGYTPFEYSYMLIKNNMTQTVYCIEQARALSLAAVELNKKARIHIKIDTGMGRLGFQSGYDAIKNISEIANMPNLELEGIYTHCPYTNETAGKGKIFTDLQFKEFCQVVNTLQNKSITFDIKHVCNSLGTIYYKNMHMDMVRAGIILYGSYPLFQSVLPLKPVMSLRTKIGFIKKLLPCKNVSYGRTFITSRETIVATLPLGYGDGYNRLLTNKAEVLIRGNRVPVIGTICMDQCMVDITDIQEECQIGEEVTLLGQQGQEEITIEELSQKICGFINYEYLVSINCRVPRIYKKDCITVDKSYL